MKKTIELVSNSWGLRGGHNLWLPDNIGRKQDCNASDIEGKRKGIINFGTLLPGTNIPDGTKVTITIDVPRQVGWYPATLGLSSAVDENRIIWWDGRVWHNGTGIGGATWRDHEFSWIADEPIPDPFERVPQ